MANQYKNKVIYGNQTLMDITDTTATENDVLEGEVFYSASGARGVGTLGDATTSAHGLMSVEDKVKLNNINEIQIDKTLDTPAAVMSFSDGADNLPMALTVGIEPVQDLHGYDHPWPAGGGKNLYKMRETDATNNGITVSANDDGTVNISGTASSSSVSISLIGNLDELNEILSQGGTFVMSLNKGAYNSSTFNVSLACKESDNGAIKWLIPGSAITVHPGASIIASNLYVTNGTTVTTQSHFAIQIEKASAATSFAPYSNICPISGWMGAKVVRTGKNLLISNKNFENAQTVLIDSDSTRDYPTYLEGGTYTISFNRVNSAQFNVYCKESKAESRINLIINHTYTSATFTVTAGWYRFWIYESGGVTASDITNIQLEVGSVATAYEPFGAEYPISFPSEAGTVYGGELTINQDGTGTLVVDKGEVDMGTLTWEYENQTDFKSSNITNFKYYAYTEVMPLICTMYPCVTGSISSMPDKSLRHVGVNNAQQVIVKDSAYTSASDFETAMSGVKLVYELATPVTYTLTAPQVHALLGLNNVWADTGDILSIIYSADTIGLINIYDKVKLNNINLLGVKLNTTTLTPDANGYVSIPLMTGATSSADGTAGLIPAPASADREKFFRGDGTWQDGGKPMVILSYGNSTWNDFITAYNNKVIVYCRASSNANPATGSQTRMAFMAYVNNADNPTNVEFQYYRSVNPTQKSASQMSDQVFVYTLTSAGAWSVTTRQASIQSIAAASGSKIGVSYSNSAVTLSNTMTANDMPMSSSDATTAKAVIDTLNSNKADKVSNATSGDVATLDGNGNLVDSGKTLGVSVPIPAAGDADKYLKGDGTWAEVSSGSAPVEDKPFSVTVSDWTLVNNEYKAEVTNSSITADCLVDVMYDKNFSTYAAADIFSEKSIGKVTLYTDSIPTGTITGNIRIFMGDVSVIGETKADKVSGATAGHLASLNSNGNLLDSGKTLGISIPEPASGDSSKFLRGDGTWAPAATDVSGKADKVSNATEGNFAGLDANGNLTDSGHKHSDYLTSHQDISGKADKVTSATNGDVATLDGNGNLVDSGKTLGVSVPANAVFTDTDNTFVATYGTTTLAQVLAAYNAGKIITCYRADNTMTYNLTRYTSDTFYFKSFGSSAATNYGIYVDADGWHANSYGYKLTQTAVSDPTASGTSITFIDSISQNTSGVITPTKKTVSIMSGASSNAAGTAGLVPAPAIADKDKYLKGSGEWAVLDIPEGSTALSLTATALGWTGEQAPYTQTVSATGVTTTNTIIVGMSGSFTTAQKEAIEQANILCTAQSTNSITLTAYGAKPEIDVPFGLVILG